MKKMEEDKRKKQDELKRLNLLYSLTEHTSVLFINCSKYNLTEFVL